LGLLLASLSGSGWVSSVVVYQAVGEYGETYSKLYRSWYDLQGVLLADEWLANEYNNGSVTIVELEIL
jgi:hypothetical protein